MPVELLDGVAPRRNAPSSLRADFSWMFVGNAIYAAGQFLTLMLLAKMLRPDLVGQYALGLAIVYPVSMFTNLQLRAVIASDTREQTHFGHYLTLRLFSTAVALMIVFAITRLLGYSWELTTVVLMVGAAYSVETVSDIYYGRLQLNDRMAEISKSLIARAVLSVLGLALLTYFTRNLLLGLSGILLARAIVLFSYDISENTHGLERPNGKIARSDALKPRFDLGVHRKLLWFSLPLGVVLMLSTMNSSIPAYFIKHALGERDLGIFTTIGFMVSVGNMAVVSFGQSAFTRLARCYAAEDLAGFRSLLSKLVLFGAGIGFCGIVVSKLAGRQILTILFRPEYAERADLLPWIMAVGGVVYMAQFLGYGLTAAKHYNSQVVLNVLANISLLIACYALVAGHGLLGVIFSMLIAAMVQFLCSIVILIAVMRNRTRVCAATVEAA